MCLDAIQGRNPRAEQVRHVAGAEEALGPAEQRVVVLAPGHAAAGLEQRGDSRGSPHRRQDDLEAATHRGWRVVGGKRQRLLRREVEPLGLWVVLHVPASRLIDQPFAQIPLYKAGLRGQLLRIDRPGLGHRLVQPELVANRGQRDAAGAPEIAHDFAEERHQFRFVDRLHRCHRGSLSRAPPVPTVETDDVPTRSIGLSGFAHDLLCCVRVLASWIQANCPTGQACCLALKTRTDPRIRYASDQYDAPA